MTTETTTLTAWLLEQIAADEAVARANLWHEWTASRCEEDLKWWVGSPEVGDLYSTGYVGNGDSEPAAIHIATHDPARALATCAAHRAIVESAYDYSPELADGDNGEYAFDIALRALASIYADRDGFDTRWVA